MLEFLEIDAVFCNLASTCRSAEQDTPSPIGSEAPWRGKRITRTS